MNFGQALEHVKAGARVARAGWNGKSMFIWLNEGSHDFPADAPFSLLIGGVSDSLFAHGMQGTATRMPNINMRAAGGAPVTGWLASQTDMLAEDWDVVGGEALS